MDLLNVLSNLRGSGKTKKLEAIADYVEENYNQHYEFEQAEDILDTGINYSKDDYDNFMDIVTRNHSRHTPFYIYRMNLRENKKTNDLEQLLCQISQEIANHDADSRYRFTKVDLKKNNILEMVIYYEQYNTFYKGGERQRDGVIKKGMIRVIFNIKDQYLYINIGEDAINNIVRKFLTENLYTCIEIEPLRVTEANIKYNGPIGNDKVTIFMLELLTQKLKEENDFIINDYIKIGISNPSNDKIKSVMLKGNNLLEDKDIASKIQNGFKLKTADFSSNYIQLNNSNVLNFTVSISILSTVKISIIESTDRRKNLEIVKKISDNIFNLLNTEITLKSDVITHYFGSVKSIIQAQKRATIYAIMEQIKQDEELKKHFKKIKNIISNAI
ncbi:MAG: hypothetical protein HFJ29_04110 [Clostridia bacterium]|nr:hypothetical protein [Clostridia bacterium]